MRKIELNLLTDCLSQAELDAVTYLTTWSLGSYDLLYIAQERNADIAATYSKSSNQNQQYFIMAVFNEDTKKYSFQS